MTETVMRLIGETPMPRSFVATGLPRFGGFDRFDTGFDAGSDLGGEVG